jgi:micrococcal nuclease
MIAFPEIPAHAWVHNAHVVRVIDGDTIDVELEGGFHNVQTERLRLWGINAPEVRGPERPAGLAATAYAYDWLAMRAVAWRLDRWPFRVLTIKGQDSFGRYLVICWSRGDGRCLNADLLAEGHARRDER